VKRNKISLFCVIIVLMGLCSCSRRNVGVSNDHKAWRSNLSSKYPSSDYKMGVGACDIRANDVPFAIECARRQALLNLVNSISSNVEGVALLTATKSGQDISYNISEKSTLSLDDLKYTEPHIENTFVSIAALIDLEAFRLSLSRKIAYETKRLRHKDANQTRLAIRELSRIEGLVRALYPDMPFVDQELMQTAQSRVDAYIDSRRYFNPSNNHFVSRAVKSEGFKLTSSPRANDITVNYIEQITTIKSKDGLYLSSGLATIRLSSTNLKEEFKTDNFKFYAPNPKDAERRLVARLGLEAETLLIDYFNR
jgi:hypothetical protein